MKYDLLKRGTYTMTGTPGKFHAVKTDKAVPLQLLEAENAVEIAQVANADQYAKDTYDSADSLLRQAEAYQARKAGSKPVIMTSREAVQNAETARLLALKRQEDERIAREKQEAADREAAARAAADESARQKGVADAQAAESARGGRTSAKAAEEKAAAEAGACPGGSRAAEGRTGQADARMSSSVRPNWPACRRNRPSKRRRRRTACARRPNRRSSSLRQQLLEQFNLILETRDTARGLIVNMSDVLFDFNKYTLRPAAREKLAKISGIILSHPGLRLEVDGYTDSIGSEDYNLKLSEQRAEGVRDYLDRRRHRARQRQSQRASARTIRWHPTTTPPGRQKNRRVEMVVSGDIIGTPIGTAKQAQ